MCVPVCLPVCYVWRTETPVIHKMERDTQRGPAGMDGWMDIKRRERIEGRKKEKDHMTTNAYMK